MRDCLTIAENKFRGSIISLICDRQLPSLIQSFFLFQTDGKTRHCSTTLCQDILNFYKQFDHGKKLFYNKRKNSEKIILVTNYTLYYDYKGSALNKLSVKYVLHYVPLKKVSYGLVSRLEI